VSRLRVAFMGTSDFAVPALRRVSEVAHTLAVVTQPDRPAGRGHRVAPPPVKVAAENLGLPVLQPERAGERSFRERLRALDLDMIVVAAFGQLLPQRLLDVPRFGCLNIHPSCLPKYRGAAPIQWALWNGDSETAITIMQLDAGEDTGPILAQMAVPIEPTATTPELSRTLAEASADLLASVIVRYPDDPPEPRPQNDAEATHAPRLTKEMGDADWTLDAGSLYGRFRACVPWPGTHTSLPDGSRVTILECEPSDEDRGLDPGSLREDNERLRVQCGVGSLAIMRLRPENRSAMTARDYINGCRGGLPSRFCSAPTPVATE